ncbi:MAG: hypothetical protein NZ927_05960 [Candidatus Calescibacterium sp.]|nr:hypothetical protein [Candidatus Calescibacterium sp.]MCX7734560.1 hypothetical protein [bacterium]
MDESFKEESKLMVRMKFGNKGEHFIFKIRKIDDYVGKIIKIVRLVEKSRRF